MKWKTHDDVVHIVLLDLGSEVNVDLNPVLRVLFFDGLEQGAEPLRGTIVTDDPCEVDLRRVRSR